MENGGRRETWAGDPEAYRRLESGWQEALLHDLRRIHRGKRPAADVTGVVLVAVGEQTVTLGVRLPFTSLSAAERAAVRDWR